MVATKVLAVTDIRAAVVSERQYHSENVRQNGGADGGNNSSEAMVVSAVKLATWYVMEVGDLVIKVAA